MPASQRTSAAQPSTAKRAVAEQAITSTADLLVLEDPLELLVLRSRTEAEIDRVDALAMFAAARTYERHAQNRPKGQRDVLRARALRLYQRAMRRDPKASGLGWSVVTLAYHLGHYAEARRYAVLAASIEGLSPISLQELAADLVKSGDYADAAKLYAKELAVVEEAGGKSADVFRMVMGIGRLHHLAGQYREAADHFERADDAIEHPEASGLDARTIRRLLDDSAVTYRLFGECYLMADRPDRAIVAFEKADKLFKNEALLLFNRARVYARNGQTKKALTELLASCDLQLVGEGTLPYKLLAELLDELGRSRELIERLQRLHEKEPDNVSLSFFLSLQYRLADRFEEAEQLCIALTKRKPPLPEQAVTIVHQNLIGIYHKTDRPGAILATLAKAFGTSGVGEAFGAEGENLAADATMMRKLIELARDRYKDNPERLAFGTRLGMAMLAADAQQADAAAEFFRLAIDAQPDRATELTLIWGIGLMADERFIEAIDVFRQALVSDWLDADDAATFGYYLAGALAFDGQIDVAITAASDAIEAAEQAVARAADRLHNADEDDKRLVAAHEAATYRAMLPRLQGRVAWIFFHAKRYAQAADAYRNLIEIHDARYHSDDIRDILCDARLVLSYINVLDDDSATAEEWLEQVLDEFPGHVGASNDLGYLWADQGRHLDRALTMIRRAVDEEPDNIAYRDSLGWALYRLGRYDEAVASLEKAIEPDRLDGVILDHLGDAYLRAGRPNEANATWQRAAAVLRENGEPQKATAIQQKTNPRKTEQQSSP